MAEAISGVFKCGNGKTEEGLRMFLGNCDFEFVMKTGAYRELDFGYKCRVCYSIVTFTVMNV